MGLSSVETVPLRFRPLVKAQDYPSPAGQDNPDFTRIPHKPQAPALASNDSHWQDTDFPPSPDELRSQYTEFQRKIIAEQMSGDYQHYSQSPERAATLRQGMDYEGNVGQTSPRTSPRVDKARLNAYAQKLEADRSAAIEQTRKKFVRNIDEDYVEGKMGGLAIGTQMDKETMQRTKREKQAAYQQQLENDLRSRPIAADRKVFERRAASPQNQSGNLMDRIGDRTDGSGMSETEHRRREAQRILAANRDDVLARLNEGTSPEAQRVRHASMHNRSDEVAKFEEAPYRYIGGGNDSNNKDRKKAMQQQYLAQLLADNGPPAQGRSVRREEPEYANRTGWTGLNIGGHSLDESNHSAASTEKHLKQAAYKRLLDQQKLQAEDLARMDAERYGRY